MKKFKLKKTQSQLKNAKENSASLIQLLLEVIKLRLILKILEFLEK